MPGVDWIPGVSHLKAAIQVVTGDTEGAKTTITNFHRECPGFSQITSLAQLAVGDTEGALETQKQCLGTVNNVANGIPLVGHTKGVIHHMLGDHEGGNEALNAATRTTVVIASGTAAALATGGVGAIPAGITAGVSYDAIASAISEEDQGYIRAIRNVADNPSAGTIFDAVAIPVGDGLAGHSGGQIAKGISKGIRVSRLKASRAATLEKLDAVMDQQGSSGTAVKLGHEINALSSEINLVESGTRKYWLDAKSGQVISDVSTSNVGSFPMSGYTEENNQREMASGVYSSKRVSTSSSVKQEDALYYDSYEEANVTENNKQGRQKKLEEKDKQEPLEESLQGVYGNVHSTKLKVLKRLLESINDPNRNPDKPNNNMSIKVHQLISRSLLLLIMPDEFWYTLAVQLNNMSQGLYHSLIRHIDEWDEVIDFKILIKRLSPLMTEIKNLASTENRTNAKEAREKFLEARQRLSQEIYNDLQIAMAEIQMSMYRFIQENLIFDNFLGRNVNDNGDEQLLFKVKARDGTERVMIICTSRELFKAMEGDTRPIRLIITVFFGSYEAFKRKTITETKEEFLKKKKK